MAEAAVDEIVEQSLITERERKEESLAFQNRDQKTLLSKQLAIP